MKDEEKTRQWFFAGIFVGVLFSMTFFLVMYFLDIQILPASSLASDIRNRAEIVESYIDSYYWKDDVSDQTISEYAAKGMVAALGDKYSAYFTSEELKKQYGRCRRRLRGNRCKCALR